MPGDVRVRFYAAAADAAGTRETTISLDAESTPLEAFLASLPGALDQSSTVGGPSLSGVCGYSSFLINAVQAKRGTATLSDGDTLDILPPFAGG